MREIIKDLFYVGVNDRVKTLFEGLWPLPVGVSYNSYLLKDSKTVLFDTVESDYAGLFFHHLEDILDGRKLDYLVINHMEPDHSGSIAILKKRFPEIQIVGNKRTLDMLSGYYSISDNVILVEDGEELDLGNHKLKFFLTPMVHWPETMMTFETTTGTLFSGDAFGCFGSLDGGVTDIQLNLDKYWDEMIRYYSNIVGKYGSPVQKALKKTESLSIQTICSTHGPVWTAKENIEKVVGIYDRLSRYEAEDGVVIAYASMYGHTEGVAEMIASELSLRGIKNIVVHNLSITDPSYVIRDVFKYNTLIVGSPTYNNQLFPKVESFLSQIQARDIKNRYFACFGSFSWAGAAVKHLISFSENSNFELLGEPVEMKQAQFDSIREKVKSLSQAIAEKLK
ncbi:FprA family A-type flavoprotein [Bacteroidales bacterium OttesenSCG-928-A17]|nr:FprA family A-type flavoprotein [Bacteroidales bacterium OttesenSCG-928-A17]